MPEKEVLISDVWTPGFRYEYDDGNFNTLISAFARTRTKLPEGCTHFGVVLGGEMTIGYGYTVRRLQTRDFFSVIGSAVIIPNSLCAGVVISARDYNGLNIFGGPLEDEGRLRYIDGCTDTLLAPPVRKGDPCLNHLHFPKGIRQTPHTHPSVRAGVVFNGSGECVVPESDKVLPLKVGSIFIIKTDTVHSFNTTDETMDVVAFHPDSDVGMTDDDRPMVNRTMVDGVSAKLKPEIRTK